MKALRNDDAASLARDVAAEMNRRRECLRAHGFRHAFYDFATATVHPSRHADGSPAEAHVLDGLPEAVVVVRTDGGKVLAAKATLVAGFERGGFFFTQDAAWRASRDWFLPA